jgi:hypothetical protein
LAHVVAAVQPLHRVRSVLQPASPQAAGSQGVPQPVVLHNPADPHCVCTAKPEPSALQRRNKPSVVQSVALGVQIRATQVFVAALQFWLAAQTLRATQLKPSQAASWQAPSVT